MTDKPTQPTEQLYKCTVCKRVSAASDLKPAVKHKLKHGKKSSEVSELKRYCPSCGGFTMPVSGTGETGEPPR